MSFRNPGSSGTGGASPDLSGYQQKAEKDQAAGYAGLGADGLVPAARVPLVGAPLARTLNRRSRLSLELLDPAPVFTGSLALGVSIYWVGAMRVAEILGATAINAPDGQPAKYYLWESTDHDSRFQPGTAPGGIFLRAAQSPLGPWTARTPVFTDTGYSETETPSVLYMPGLARPFYMYYQCYPTGGFTLQHTRLVSSANGRTGWVQEPIRNMLGPSATWADKTLRISTTNESYSQQEHTGYFNPQSHGGRLIAYSRTVGVVPDAFGVWHSYDGLDWMLDPRPLRYNSLSTGSPALFLAPSQWHPFMLGGQLYTLTTLANRAVPLIRDPVIVPMAADMRTIVGPATHVLTVTQGWEDPSLVTHVKPFLDIDGTLYVFITYGSTATGIYRLAEVTG